MSASEVVAMIRDIVIILFVGMGFFFAFVLLIMTWLLYRKVSPLIDSAKRTAKNAEEISSTFSERVVKPVVARSIFAHGAGQVLSFILGFRRRKGGPKNG